MTIASFADLIAPMTPETFYAEYHGKKPVHITGWPGKFDSVLTWDGLSGLLNQNNIWTRHALAMVMDTRPLQPPEYCYPGKDRDGRDNMLVDFGKVSAWLRRGASLVLNDIDTLTPGLKAISSVLETELNAKAQGNLYCSWKAHQGFGSHFDTHDVYAVHVAGKKTWHIYQRHFQDPIAHPVFKSLSDEFHEKNKGPLSLEAPLEPGDLLYIPRGWYHHALATSQATFHIAFGMTTVIGLDLLAMVFERAVHDPLFRATVPSPKHGAGRAFADHLAELGNRLATYPRESDLVAQFEKHMERFRYPRWTLTLPDDAVQRRFRKSATNVSVFQRDNRWWIGSAKKGAPIPPGLDTAVQWIVDQQAFAETDFSAAFPDLAPAAREKLLGDMTNMGVIKPE